MNSARRHAPGSDSVRPRYDAARQNAETDTKANLCEVDGPYEKTASVTPFIFVRGGNGLPRTENDSVEGGNDFSKKELVIS